VKFGERNFGSEHSLNSEFNLGRECGTRLDYSSISGNFHKKHLLLVWDVFQNPSKTDIIPTSDRHLDSHVPYSRSSSAIVGKLSLSSI